MSLGLYKEQVQMRFGLGTGSGGEALGVSRYDKYAKNGLSINMAVKEGGTHSLFINGANVLSESGKKEQTAGISQEMYIGKGISAGTDYYFKGKIAEVIVYDGVLSEDQVSIVNAYLRQKYNITDDGSEENTVNAIVSAELSPISVPKGTTREKLVLPFSIDVTLEEEFSNITQPTPSKNTKIPVVWDTSTFDPEKIGIPQDIYGTLNISLGKSVKDRTISTIVPVGNPSNVKAHVQVIGKMHVPAAKVHQPRQHPAQLVKLPSFGVEGAKAIICLIITQSPFGSFCGRRTARHSKERRTPAVAAGVRSQFRICPWQCLYFLPLPQGHGSLRETLPQVAGSFGSTVVFAYWKGTAFSFSSAGAPAFPPTRLSGLS